MWTKTSSSRAWILAIFLTFVAGIASVPSPAQQLAKRLILKDGSYQLVTKYEIKGERVRYLSAERNEWEELPKSMVDWAATEKYEKQRAEGAPPPEVVELDKELDTERRAEEARNPLVAPGLHLPESGGVILLDTYQGQPQLVELDQSGGEIKRNMKGNIFRAAINPVASAKQTVELPGLHAKVQAHAAVPAVYVNIQNPDQGGADAQTGSSQPQQTDLPWDRFKIVRAQAKEGKRIVGTIKIAVYGKTSQQQSFIDTTAQQLTGSWVKVTPKDSLAPGEYAVVEMLGKDGMNTYVWDFGVNPAAPANMQVTKPDASAPAPQPEKPIELEKRPK